MTRADELNLDGLVGPTHNYGGLSFGNVASMSYQAHVSNPREAALQGLRKMKAMAALGLRQGVLPPQERPAVAFLRTVGFGGSDQEVVAQASREELDLFLSASSASSMWTANAATVSPSADTRDGRVHFTPANLTSKLHRSIEPPQTARTLRAIFGDEAAFAHHEPLPPGAALADEGAANHTRLCPEYGVPGVELFVFGRHAFRAAQAEPAKFPARQSREACAALARGHGLDPARTLLVQQNPAAIDAGVFHNDVASVGNADFFFCHELAFLDQPRALSELREAYRRLGRGELRVLEVPASEVPLEAAVKSYLFNSQLVSLEGGLKMALIAPLECAEIPEVKAYLDRLSQSGHSPFDRVETFDLRQSMRNGGGPACLRLRVVLTEAEQGRMNPGVLLTDALYDELVAWVERHYRDRIIPADLGDPKLLDESRRALDELTHILKLGSIYPFQGAG